MSLLITTAPYEKGINVLVEGEVDVSNAAELREALDAALALVAGAVGSRHVEVDVSKVPYIDSTGIGVLVGTAHRAADQGATFSVAHPQRNVARVLSLLGLDGELGVRGAQE